ncbi:hypothetical protein F5Y15DRAFT_369058 [Xylariaceae sp. FL0016]|nr:hypothetical protein F5Y15DRAFT_369058 [Xylariaceae sp. FL0016]
MARLNEPTVSTESIETLRRKFLRQNRDIARINSTQSLKIRSLENECARMLSENLELRGRILHLETELQESRTQRIADHALEIKEKMEAQLVEWGSMLASLGHEPIPKHRSPRAPKKAKTRSSLGHASMSQWKRRDTISSMKDLEEAAMQEGRLPPLWEDKSYPRDSPRRTLTRDDILALRSVVDDNAESPDLGPPPVSRFVDEDPVKIDLPTKAAILASPKNEYQVPKEPSSEHDDIPSPPTATPSMEEFVKRELVQTKVESIRPSTKTNDATQPPVPEQAAKAGLKRKIREDDDKENGPASRPLAPKPAQERALSAKPRSMNRPLKDLSSDRKDAKEKPKTSTQRKPLSAKSSNEALNTPKKPTKSTAVDEISKAKADVKRDDHAKEQGRERTKPKKEAVPVPVQIPTPPPAEPAPVASIEIEQEILSADPDLAIPDSPAPSAPGEALDTPPPADISSRGETSRGSRRARAAVSYAEPNLRDKMRRPTKQLFDAVAGEGKHMRRTSHSKTGSEPPSASSSVVKSEARRDLIAKLEADETNPAVDIMTSPLIRKTSRASPSDDLPTSAIKDRKKRIHCVSGESDSLSAKLGAKGGNRRLDEIAAQEAEVAKLFEEETDVYEFPVSSPGSDDLKRTAKPEQETGGGSKKSKGSRQQRSRRLSSMAREDLEVDNSETGSKPRPHGGSKKRASMVVMKSSRLDTAEDEDGTIAEGDSMSSASSAEVGEKDKPSTRRRSMML